MPSQPCCLLPTNQGTLITTCHLMTGVLPTNQGTLPTNQGTLTSSHVMIGVLPTNQGTLTASHVMIGVLVTKKTFKKFKMSQVLGVELAQLFFSGSLLFGVH